MKITGPIGERLCDQVDRGAIDRVGSRLRSSTGRSTAARIGRGVLIATAAVVAMCWLDRSRLAPHDEPRAFEAGASPLEVTLADGSTIWLEPGTRLARVPSDHGTRWAQERGEARYEIARQPAGSTFEIQAGALLVTVVGTEFTIARDPEAVRVAVDEGTVIVSGAPLLGEPARLHAGEVLALPARAAPPPPQAVTVAAPSPAPPEPTPVIAPAEPVARSARIDPRVQLREADTLRAAGRTEDAIAVLERVRRSRLAPHAGLAAFTLGRLYAEADRSAEAARAFEDAVALGIPVALELRAIERIAALRAEEGP